MVLFKIYFILFLCFHGHRVGNIDDLGQDITYMASVPIVNSFQNSFMGQAHKDMAS
jgi:hypothetical protein